MQLSRVYVNARSSVWITVAYPNSVFQFDEIPTTSSLSSDDIVGGRESSYRSSLEEFEAFFSDVFFAQRIASVNGMTSGVRGHCSAKGQYLHELPGSGSGKLDSLRA